MEAKGFTEALTALQPIVTEAKVAFVSPVFTVDEVAEAAFDDPGAEAQEQDKGDADGQYQTRDAVGVAQAESRGSLIALEPGKQPAKLGLTQCPEQEVKTTVVLDRELSQTP